MPRIPPLLRGSLLGVVGGLLLSASFEPVALPVLLPLALACFAWATTGLTARSAALAGWLFGVAFYYTHIAWMRTSIGTDAWIALAGIESAAYALVGTGAALVRRLPGWPFWLAVVWVAAEGVRSTWPFSGMPWGRISFAAIDTPVAPAAAYLGMTGLSFALALVGFTIAWAFERCRADKATPAPTLSSGLTRLLAPVGVLAALVVPAVAPFPLEDAGAAQVAAVQGNLPGPANDILYDPLGVTTNHSEATIELADEVAAGSERQPDFVLWPENSTASDPFFDSSVNAAIVAAVGAVGVPVVVGGIVDEGRDFVLNQGIVWDPETGPGERYTKQHPVPYGEYIPFRDIWNPQFGKLALIKRDMLSGTRRTPLPVAGIELADAICFDIAYDDVITPQVRAGAELLTVQTSNASFIFTHQIEQQFAITRLRAIETGRWLVVASTNGRSGVIAPDGSVVATADPRTTAVLNERVRLSTTLTPAMWLGMWPARVFAVLAVGALVLGAVQYRRGRGRIQSYDPRPRTSPDGDPDLQRGGEPGVDPTAPAHDPA